MAKLIGAKIQPEHSMTSQGKLKGSITRNTKILILPVSDPLSRGGIGMKRRQSGSAQIAFLRGTIPCNVIIDGHCRGSFIADMTRID